MKVLKRILLVILILAVVLAAALAVQYLHKSDPSQILTYSASNPFITPERMQVCAHRSGAGIMPEETMMAFKNCVESEDFSADWIEFDLHITADDVLVLLHDDELDRTSDSEAVFGTADVDVSSKTLAELKQLNMGCQFEAEDGSHPYADPTEAELEDLRIVTLDEALDYLTSQGDFHYIIEVKNGGDAGKRSTDLLYQDLQQRGMLDRVFVGSFHDEICAYMDETCPDLLRCAGTSEVLAFIKACFLQDQDYDPAFDILDIPYGSLKETYGINTGTAMMINYAHAHDLAVFYWTINDPDQMEYLTSVGADGLITDYPNLAAQYQYDRKYS